MIKTFYFFEILFPIWLSDWPHTIWHETKIPIFSWIENNFYYTCLLSWLRSNYDLKKRVTLFLPCIFCYTIFHCFSFFFQVIFSLESGNICEELLQVLRTFGIGSRYQSSISVIPCALYYKDNYDIQAGTEKEIAGLEKWVNVM